MKRQQRREKRANLYVRTYQSQFGVGPICEVLNEHGIQIAPSTYYAYASRGFGPTEAEYDDAYAANELRMLWVANRCLYGRRKLWKTAVQAKQASGRDQVERLMKIVRALRVQALAREVSGRGRRRGLTAARSD